MKQKLLDFFHSLSTYDYIFYISAIVVFVVLILLILLLRKRVMLSLFLLLVAILEISLVPTFGHSYFHNEILYKNDINITKIKRLHYVDAVLIEGRLKNSSKLYFKSCKIKAVLTRDRHNKLLNAILKLKPIKSSSIYLQDIDINSSKNFRLLIEPFRYKKDFLVDVSGICK